MVRRAVWQELGGFDEGFFPLWFEDVDFCRRVADRDITCITSPSGCEHTGAHSIRRLTVEMRRVYWYCSLLRYSAKHFRPTAFRAVCLAVVMAPFRGASRIDSRSEPGAFGSVRESRGFASRCLLYVRPQSLGCKGERKDRPLRFWFMAQNDFVSVTIVTYDSGRFIKRCLESCSPKVSVQRGHRCR